MVAPLQQMPPWLQQQPIGGAVPPWAMGGQPAPPVVPPPAMGPNLWQQATGQGNTPAWLSPSQQGVTSPDWNYTSAATPGASRNPGAMAGYTIPATDPSYMLNTTEQSNGQARMGLGQPNYPTVPQAGQPGTETKTGLPETGAPGIANAPVVGEFNATPGAAGGTGAAWQGQDYRLPSGEVLPGYANTTVTLRNGTKVRIPGFYEPGKDTVTLMNGTYRENAFQRFQRRLSDAAERGEDPNDANVIYRELARVRDDTGGQNTGFVHLDRFVRGANGETGFTGPGGAQPGATGTGPTMPGTSSPGQETADPAAAPGAAPAPGGGTLKNFGQMQTDDLAALLQAAANDPDRAAQILRMARGQGGERPKGRMGEFRDNLYGRAFQAALSLAGTDGFSGLEGEAGSFLNNAVLGNNLLGHGADIGRRVGGQSFEGVDSRTMEQMLRAGLALQGIGMGSLGGAVQSGRLEDIIYQDWARNLQDSSNDTRNFADLLKGSAFQRAMANFR